MIYPLESGIAFCFQLFLHTEWQLARNQLICQCFQFLLSIAHHDLCKDSYDLPVDNDIMIAASRGPAERGGMTRDSDASDLKVH